LVGKQLILKKNGDTAMGADNKREVNRKKKDDDSAWGDRHSKKKNKKAQKGADEREPRGVRGSNGELKERRQPRQTLVKKKNKKRNRTKIKQAKTIDKARPRRSWENLS